ncbi:hypothetical protein SEPCBS57363_003594 [Sporothrix epigloea]|uniref:Nineteen complex-related protein 2-domain-containing protein n=1 Tax=Sporothrix epigloea TaxID=1892477 RepID=A0ABP0DQ44_9PEZI
MSLFTKRKGRRIASLEDEKEGEELPTGSGVSPSEEAADTSTDPVIQPMRFGKRQPKQSALRRGISINDNVRDLGDADGDEASRPNFLDENNIKYTGVGNDDAEEDSVVVRPVLSRSGSRRNKKRLSTASSSLRLSFGGAGDVGDEDTGPVVVTPNKRGAGASSSLTQRVLENNAFRKSLSGRLPTRYRASGENEGEEDTVSSGRNADGFDEDDDDDRPRYSQAYLDELQSSTPNTPQNLNSFQRNDGVQKYNEDSDLMDLDPSELDGAMVVDASELPFTSAVVSGSSLSLTAGTTTAPAGMMMTTTQIQERKERRARRALEGDAFQSDPDGDEENGEYISLLTDEQRRKKHEKERTRLVREDEDLGEGFDEFVEEKEALSIGRKAERAARRKRKEEMAALIDAAELGDDVAGMEGGTANDSGDDSEAERRAAYDAAQTRAGMEGLHRWSRNGNDDEDDGSAGGVHGSIPIPRMRPLPDLAMCLKQIQNTLEAMEMEAAQHRRKLNEVEQEKAEIAAREAEVQAVLDAAAAKYQHILGEKAGVSATAQPPAASFDTNNTHSPLRAIPTLGQTPLPPGLTGVYPIQRGLESLGTTPLRRPSPGDVLGD